MANRKFNFGRIMKTQNSKQRILLISVVVLVLILFVYFLSKVIRVGSNAEGDSRVSGVPSISSVQGGKVSPEYARALTNENQQKVDYANTTGTSAIPTLINTGVSDMMPVQVGCTNCCNTCGGESTDQLLSTLLGKGKISASTADLLNQLDAQNLSPEDYAAALEKLVRDGKISPEEARRLLAAYKQRYQDKLGSTGATDLDPLIKQGILSVESASDLLSLQKKPSSLFDYQQSLENMIDQGQISPTTAQLLLKKYDDQEKKRQLAEASGQLASMVATGDLSPEQSSTLKALQASDITTDDYSNALNKLVKEAKISPDIAKRLFANYSKLHGNADATLVSGTELSKEQGDALRALQKANKSVAEFSAQLEAYARSGKISANSASQLLTAYQEEYTAKQSGDAARAARAAAAKDGLISELEQKPKLPTQAAQSLTTMRKGQVSLSDYAAELQRLVEAGLISPETAQALLAAYKKQLAQGGFSMDGNGVAFSGLSAPTIDMNLGAKTGNPTLDRVTQAGYAQQATQMQQTKTYTAAAALQQQNQQIAALQQAQVQELSTQMYAQAQQLFSPLLTPVAQTMVVGEQTDQTMGAGGLNGGSSVSGDDSSGLPPIIKAGSVLYGVLETAVDSDYPDSPVMATIVSGEFKGAKLLGAVKTVKDGQRVMLTFNLMTMNDWPTGASVNAYAIDPDSARSALATSVDNHYMLRYGTLFASAFMQGLGQAVEDSGTTVTSDSGVVTESTSDLNTQEQILVALGQVGKSASTEVAKLQNTPPTVKVKAGVGIGILFMADVGAVNSK